jgi:hypothetical protein
MLLKPGETVQLHARLFDAAGRFLREDKAVWSLDKLNGTVTDGKLTVASSGPGQAGLIKATVAGVTGEARARVIPALPWNETFDSYAVGSVPPHWISATTVGKFQVVELDGRTAFTRRANLLAPLTLFLRVKEAGPYEVLLEGPEARARIEPFLTWRPQRYQSPPLKGSGSVWDLEAGFYTLTAEPVKRGIVTFTIRAKGLVAAALSSVGIDRAVAEIAEAAGADELAPIPVMPKNCRARDVSTFCGRAAELQNPRCRAADRTTNTARRPLCLNLQQ